MSVDRRRKVSLLLWPLGTSTRFSRTSSARSDRKSDSTLSAACSGLAICVSTSIVSFRKRYIDEFHEDMRLLGCLPPSLEPRATAHIPAMIDTIAQIIDNGHAYAVDGDVFFDIQTLPGYGRLSRHTQVDVLLRIKISSPAKG